MKFATFSDLHIHNYKAFDKDGSRLDNSLKVIDDIFDYCFANRISTVLFPGDLYHLQKVLPVSAVNRTIQTFQKAFKRTLGKVTLYAISGNHDFAVRNMYGRHATTALQHLDEIFENFVLIDNSVKDFKGLHVEVYGLPYYDHKEEFKKALDGLKMTDTPNVFRVLMIHQTPSGLIDFPIPSDCDPLKDFDRFNLVLCGHIHTRRKMGDNFWLVGSPLMQSFQDPLEDRGFMTFDVQPMGKNLFKVDDNFIDLGYPKFVTVNKSEAEKYSDHYIKLLNDFQEFDIDPEGGTLDIFDSSMNRKLLLEKYFLTLQNPDNQLLETGMKFL